MYFFSPKWELALLERRIGDGTTIAARTADRGQLDRSPAGVIRQLNT